MCPRLTARVGFMASSSTQRTRDKRIPESEMPPESHETYIDSAKKNR